jgi:hypothetical protein
MLDQEAAPRLQCASAEQDVPRLVYFVATTKVHGTGLYYHATGTIQHRTWFLPKLQPCIPAKL